MFVVILKNDEADHAVDHILKDDSTLSSTLESLTVLHLKKLMKSVGGSAGSKLTKTEKITFLSTKIKASTQVSRHSFEVLIFVG